MTRDPGPETLLGTAPKEPIPTILSVTPTATVRRPIVTEGEGKRRTAAISVTTGRRHGLANRQRVRACHGSVRVLW